MAAIAAVQERWGEDVLPEGSRLEAELWLNAAQPFMWVSIPYLVAFLVLQIAFNWNLFRRNGVRYPLKHPLYATGMLIFAGSVAYHLFAFVLRWIASARAPMSNGYESLIFIALAVGVVGLVYELRTREGVAAGLAALLTSVILGTAMLSTFDPAIGPLVPVLASYWLHIHVTVITASYAFLGLCAALGAQTLFLYLAKAPGRSVLRSAIHRLDRLNTNVMIAGLGFLTVGTLLGGVWANESWGRYWGWDPKETWSFVTILVYALILHFRFIPQLRSAWLHAAASLAAISSVVMTYFGVNYFLSGLHSYAAGEAARVPGWVHIGVIAMAVLIGASYAVRRARRWRTEPEAVGQPV
ncbi:MAG: cytochrome c biogenesis protein CcsA [Candidatus Krumholzibacteriia bacterium]